MLDEIERKYKLECPDCIHFDKDTKYCSEMEMEILVGRMDANICRYYRRR